jgi:hypothetical protein
MILGMLVVRHSPLFTIMVLVFLLSLLLTLVQVVTGNDTIALLFPWRTSAILVPIATAVILAKILSRLDGWLSRCSSGQARAFLAGSGALVGCMAAAGAAIMFFGLGYRSDADELPLLDFVRAHKQPGDTYLLPVSVPASAAGRRGVFSTNFTPPPRTGTDLIAIDLQRFRIYTGAPIYIDFKCIPYRDIEVIEWRERLLWNQAVYAREDWDDLLPSLKARGITHVVASAGRERGPTSLPTVYEDAHYKLYRLK